MSDSDSRLTFTEPPRSDLADAEGEPTLFSVLAARARGHPRSHLWAATLFGAADAIAILVAYPAAWWLASASISLCAFGIWGLADDTIIRRHASVLEDPDMPGAPVPSSLTSARMLRGGAAVVGLGAGLAAALGFMAAAMGTIIS